MRNKVGRPPSRPSDHDKAIVMKLSSEWHKDIQTDHIGHSSGLISGKYTHEWIYEQLIYDKNGNRVEGRVIFSINSEKSNGNK